jgi:hypothetical protein
MGQVMDWTEMSVVAGCKLFSDACPSGKNNFYISLL